MKIIISVVLYVIVSITSLFLPAAEGYDTLLWKFIIGQGFAILIALLYFSFHSAFVILSRRDKNKSE